MKKAYAAFSMVLLAVCSSSAFAGLYHVEIDVSGLGGTDLRLLTALYDNSEVVGDSWVRMDNVALGLEKDDFEGPSWGGFVVDIANPFSVNVVSGSLDGVGSFLMRIDEDSGGTPTIAYRDYLSLSPSGTTLTFDLEMTASATEGFWGWDEFVVSLLDPVTLDPLVPGLTGLGDVLAISAQGVQYSGEASVTVVPAPAALLLGLIGLGAGGLGLWRRRTHLV